ncbi:Asp-tRNA(Asn)/Glu-tRNA(Gln) amidotransferase subunit GatB [Patescibacteria group bacterium]|nr:Asp-tRNA(Asn)/Glu-tRNA(Gln) amidotransferase subunit GatB [Patescibacteria group bacterium]
MKYIPTIGLEIHTELNTVSKMFCSCKNDSLEPRANINVCPVCMGHPGVLPVINQETIKKVVKTGIALNCKIAKNSQFERKNYFYPDLPKGYQISQYALPLCGKGFLEINRKKIGITRIHLEEEAAKLIHQKDGSLVDFNRAGIPLMELVTEPDLTSAEEAYNFARELQLILRYLGVSSADMEKGQLRVEANISIKQNQKQKSQNNKSQINSKFKIQNSKLGMKVEVKNLNSFRAVKKAIEYEIERQAGVLESGGAVVHETRGWDDKKQITVSQRSKEESHDYRYFPEPDLPPLELSDDYISIIKSEIPELPHIKRIRFKHEYFLKDEDIEIFVFNKDLGEYFEQVVSEFFAWLKDKDNKVIGDKEYQELAQIASNYILTDLTGLLAGMSVEDKKFRISAENFAEFISMLYKKEITSKIAKIVLKEMFDNGSDPSDVIEEKGLSQIDNKQELEKVIMEIIAANLRAVDDYKKGKANALQFLIGQAMAKTKGRANPEILEKLFTKSLN